METGRSLEPATEPAQIYLGPILIISSHLFVGLPRHLFPWAFPTKIFLEFFVSPCVLQSLFFLKTKENHKKKKSNSLYGWLNIRIYKIIILSVVLYVCETWSHNRNEEDKLRVCWEECLGLKGKNNHVDWEHYKMRLHNLYCLPNTIKVITPSRMRWFGHIASMVRVGNS
jgi:hypothetical protein